jgi:kynurenine formamidase
MVQTPSRLPRYDELPIDPRYPPKTAWGLFGDGDNVGMFNLQTPERVAKAARLVKRGAVFSLNWEQTKPYPTLFNRSAARHTIRRDRPFGNGGDDVLDNFYPQASSQWDGLTHVGDFEHGFWGGVTQEELKRTGDKTRLGIDHWARRGIAGRAVLLDVARWRQAQGRPIDHTKSDLITVADLEGTRAAQGVGFEPGDVLLIHTGWIDWYESLDTIKRMVVADTARMRLPGLECCEPMAEWLWNHHFCAVVSDLPALESWPPPSFAAPEGFLHQWILGRFGMAIGEMFVLGPLASDSAHDGVYDSFLVSAPLNVPGGTGSTANALAIK